MKSLFKLLIITVALLLPALAMAATINPPGGNAWDMFVYGNARAIFNILEGVKMLMVPDAGSTGFITLLLVLATIGFIVLAIGAGFDPGRNLMRMFTYIFVVYFVVFSTTSLKVNVNITDMIRDSSGASTAYTVSGAPALVVLPAALTTEIGRYFTRSIETYFVMPDEFKLAGIGSGGQFNLFGKILKESSEYVITSSELKKSLANYSTDCVIPAIALGELSGPVYNPSTKKTETGYGVDALLKTSNLSETLKSAAHKSVMTKYYPVDAADNAWRAEGVLNSGGSLDSSSMSSSKASALGVVVTCESAATLLFDENNGAIATYANLMLTNGASAWAKTGINVPFESLFSATYAPLNQGDAAFGYSKPTAMITQQALINSMNGSFRQSAIQTGNNELIQASMISQAESSQRSSWVSAALVFNNMMGYIYVTLQAFIFALTPLIVVALLVPGLGKSIFVNYAQILIWLMLWQPMLALINYLITVFGTDSISTIVSADGGLSANNKYLISAKTNDLMIAAGFLGSMVPLIAWGLVKGTLAFTEFITAGIGSSFATQAGAAAATGNVSLNNMSMDNGSMNKFSSVMSSAVGVQGVSAYMGAGSVNSQAIMGGNQVNASNSNVGANLTKASQIAEQIAYAHSYNQALSDLSSKGVSKFLQDVQSEGHSVSVGEARLVQHLAQMARTTNEGDQGSMSAQSTNKTNGTASSATDATTTSNEARLNMEGNVEIGPKAKGGNHGGGGNKLWNLVGADLGLGASGNVTSGSQSGLSNTATEGSQATLAGASATNGSYAISTGASTGGAASHSTQVSDSDVSAIQSAIAKGVAFNDIQSEAKSISDAVSKQISHLEQVGYSYTVPENTDHIAFKEKRDAMERKFTEGVSAVTEKVAEFQKAEDGVLSATNGVSSETKRQLSGIDENSIVNMVHNHSKAVNAKGDAINQGYANMIGDVVDTMHSAEDQKKLVEGTAKKERNAVLKEESSKHSKYGDDARDSVIGRLGGVVGEKVGDVFNAGLDYLPDEARELLNKPNKKK